MRRLILLVALAAAVGGCAKASAGPSGTSAPGPTPPGPAAPAPKGLPGLLSHLAILRRPAKPSDSSPALRTTLRRLAASGCERLVADPGLTRLAAVTPGGTRVYVVAFKPATCTPHCTGTARTCIRPLPRQETVAVITEPGAGFPQIATLADLEAGRAGASLRAGGRYELLVLVPDGVARLVLQLVPPTPGGAGRAYALGAEVHGNLGVFTMNAPPPATARLLWMDSSGHAIKRILDY